MSATMQVAERIDQPRLDALADHLGPTAFLRLGPCGRDVVPPRRRPVALVKDMDMGIEDHAAASAGRKTGMCWPSSATVKASVTSWPMATVSGSHSTMLPKT